MTTQRQYYYQKRCRVCQKVYFRNLITLNQYQNLADNPNISFKMQGEQDQAAEIESLCNTCSELTNA